jgi:hypothetical protein
VKPKRKSLGLILLFLVALFSRVCAAERTYSLIVAEYGEDSAGDQTQHLVRYRFKDGVLAARESILTTKTSDLRFDLGRNQIYQNRYVITTWGDVIDLATGKILYKSKGDLAGIERESNSVIVRVNRDDDRGVHAFDLASRHDRLLEQPGFWAERGMVSPDGQLSATGDGSAVWLQPRSGGKVLLGSDFGREGTFECSEFQGPTFIWLDDKHLLTQRGNGRLVVVDIKGHMEPLVTIPDVDAFGCGPDLRRDEDNHFYYVARQAWQIDVGKRTFEPYLWESRGNGFDVEYQRNAADGRAIRYRGKEIGRWWCDSFPLTAPGHLAVEFGPAGSNLGYPEGVKVWSAQNRAWTTIKPDWLVTIIGWVED